MQSCSVSYGNTLSQFSQPDLDYFPNCDQFGSLPETSKTQHCVPFSAIHDDVVEDAEEFTEIPTGEYLELELLGLTVVVI